MGLTTKDVADETPRFANWQRKKSIQNSIKASDTDLAAYGSLWRTTETSPANNQVCCTMTVHVAKVSAVVTAGDADGKSDKNIPEKLYLCKEETATWTKQNLKYATETGQYTAKLKITVPESSYTIPKY